MATGAGRNRSHVEKERARLYRARQEFHGGLQARRRRDNLVAGVAGGILLLAIVGGQVAYYTLGPGTPAPAPSPTTGTTGTPEPGSPVDTPGVETPGQETPAQEAPGEETPGQDAPGQDAPGQEAPGGDSATTAP